MWSFKWTGRMTTSHSTILGGHLSTILKIISQWNVSRVPFLKCSKLSQRECFLTLAPAFSWEIYSCFLMVNNAGRQDNWDQMFGGDKKRRKKKMSKWGRETMSKGWRR